MHNSKYTENRNFTCALGVSRSNQRLAGRKTDLQHLAANEMILQIMELDGVEQGIPPRKTA